MYCFLVKSRPISYNSLHSKKRDNYRKLMDRSILQFYGEHPLLTGDLYGKVYYFFNQNIDLDADNINKPIWDALGNGLLFEDDKQVKLRTAGVFDLTTYDPALLKLSTLGTDFRFELNQMLRTEQHILYIECGSLDLSLFQFSKEEYSGEDNGFTKVQM